MRCSAMDRMSWRPLLAGALVTAILWAALICAAHAADSCGSHIAISQTSSADIYTSHNRVHICGLVLGNQTTAQNWSLVEGTGTVCATGIQALIGGTTASVAIGANSDFAAVSGPPWWLNSAVTADHICLLQSGSTNLSGVLTFDDQ